MSTFWRSDRSTFSTMSHAERMFRQHCEERKRQHEELMTCFSLVIEAVHPAHWSVLPPSPKQLILKATLLDLKPDRVCLVKYLSPSL